MNPVQIVRIALGGEAVHLPLYRLPYVGGRDGFTAPGGFFAAEDGTFGIILDVALSASQAEQVVASEIQRNAATLAAAAAASRKQSAESRAALS